jgi:AraC-like DNA-binding protein
MTGRDNSLIKRVIKPPTNVAPMVAAGEVRVFVSGLERLGYDRAMLLAAAGLQNADLEDADVQVPCAVYRAIVERAQRERFTRNLAVLLARETRIGAYPLLDYLVVTSESVGAGVAQLARYLRLVGTPVVLEIHEETDGVRVAAESQGSPFAIEFTVSLMVLHLTLETDRQFRATAVNFAHRPDNVAEVERILGCPVRAEAGWNGLAVSHDTWRLPLRRRDSVLRGVLEWQADAIAARLPSNGGIASEVRRALASRVTGGNTGIQVVARQLGTTPRTLQRRLAEQRSSYQELLDATRQEAAAGYLAHSTLSICEIAYLLGYSEAAAFHRAFKRWNDETPQAFRARERRPASVPSERG